MRRLLSFVMIEVGNTVVAKMLPPTLLGGFPTWVLILIAVVCYGTPALVLAPASWRSRIWRALRNSPPAITWRYVAYVATAIVVVQFLTTRWPALFEQVPVEWVHTAFSLALILTVTAILWGTGVAMNWLWRRTHSTGKAHKVSADPVRFHFSVPESAVTLRRAPLWKRMLNEMKAWGKAGEG